MNALETIVGQAQGLLNNGPLVTGIVIGFILALILRGIIAKLLLLAILAFVFVQIFGVPGLG